MELLIFDRKSPTLTDSLIPEKIPELLDRCSLTKSAKDAITESETIDFEKI